MLKQMTTNTYIHVFKYMQIYYSQVHGVLWVNLQLWSGPDAEDPSAIVLKPWERWLLNLFDDDVHDEHDEHDDDDEEDDDDDDDDDEEEEEEDDDDDDDDDTTPLSLMPFVVDGDGENISCRGS